ncbi:MAG: NYN domain-containing protein [Cryomorphaceae bacterium]|nr:NYN domain-containing protein [Cryomorphaceae bacterium]
MERIGIFYDGNYFHHVSNYYYYTHERRRRLSVSGIHTFIRHHISESTGIPFSLCQIVDAHYFRGRSSAYEASQRGNQLYYDRLFDDILTHEGVTTHYLPLRNVHGRKEEKGVDISLALEAYELAMLKKFTSLVLIASDGDYLPLVRKLNTLGVKVMILAWDFEYTNHEGLQKQTRTSQDLMEVASFPIAMHEIIDNRIEGQTPVINNLFVSNEYKNRSDDFRNNDDEWSADDNESQHDKQHFDSVDEEYDDAHINATEGDELESEILSLKEGFGFIRFPNNNLFFHYSDVIDCDFNELQPGEKVSFILTTGNGGQDVAKEVRKIDSSSTW